MISDGVTISTCVAIFAIATVSIILGSLSYFGQERDLVNLEADSFTHVTGADIEIDHDLHFNSNDITNVGTFTASAITADSADGFEAGTDLNMNGNALLNVDNVQISPLTSGAGKVLKADASGSIVASSVSASDVTTLNAESTLTNKTFDAANGNTIVYNGGSTSQLDHAIVKAKWGSLYNGAGAVNLATVGDFGDTAITNDGVVYTAGSFNTGAVTFGTVAKTPTGTSEMFLVKHDSTGAVEWVQTSTGTGTTIATGVTVDGEGNAYVCGYADAAVTIGGVDLTLVGTYYSFLVKFNSAGVAQWVVKNPSGSDVHMMSLDTVPDGSSVVVGGMYTGSISLYTGQTFTGGANYFAFVAKFNTTDGSGIWATSSVTKVSLSLRRIKRCTVADNGDVYITFNTSGNGPTEVVPGTVHADDADLPIVAKYTSSGVGVWSFQVVSDFDAPSNPVTDIAVTSNSSHVVMTYLNDITAGVVTLGNRSFNSYNRNVFYFVGLSASTGQVDWVTKTTSTERAPTSIPKITNLGDNTVGVLFCTQGYPLIGINGQLTELPLTDNEIDIHLLLVGMDVSNGNVKWIKPAHVESTTTSMIPELGSFTSSKSGMHCASFIGMDNSLTAIGFDNVTTVRSDDLTSVGASVIAFTVSDNQPKVEVPNNNWILELDTDTIDSSTEKVKVVTDESKSIYKIGSFRENLKLGGNIVLTADVTAKDISYIAKYHEDGTLDWVTKCCSTHASNIYATDIFVRKGLVYVAGNFDGNATIGSDILIKAASTGTEAFFACYSATTGDAVWAKQTVSGASSATDAVSIQSNDDNTQIVAVGTFAAATPPDFGAGAVAAVGTGVQSYLVSYNHDGSNDFDINFMNSHIADPDVKATSVAISENGIYVAGHANGTVATADISNSNIQVSNTVDVGFVAKFTLAGADTNVGIIITPWTEESTIVKMMIEPTNKDVVITGHVPETETVAGTVITQYGSAETPFIAKYAAVDLADVWGIGIPAAAKHHDMDIDHLGNIYVTGQIVNDAIAPIPAFPFMPNYGTFDSNKEVLYVAKFTSTGTLIAVRSSHAHMQMPTTVPFSVAVDTDQNIIFASKFFYQSDTSTNFAMGGVSVHVDNPIANTDPESYFLGKMYFAAYPSVIHNGITHVAGSMVSGFSDLDTSALYFGKRDRYYELSTRASPYAMGTAVNSTTLHFKPDPPIYTNHY